MAIERQRLLLALRREGGSLLRRAALPAVLITATVATGCESSDSKPSPRFSTDRALQAQVGEVATRLQGSGAGDSSIDTDALHARLTDDCVRRKGVDVPSAPPAPVDPGVVPVVTDLDLWLNRGQTLGLGAALSDPEKLQQQRSFFKRSAAYRNPAYPPEAQKYVEGDPPQLLELPLPGGKGGSLVVPVGGCHGAATEKLFGVPAERYERTRLALPRVDDTLSETIAADRVDDRLGGYESCMKDVQIDAENPAALQKQLGPVVTQVLDGDAQPSKLVALEQRLVAADEACKQKSGLGTAFAETFVKRGRTVLKGKEGVTVEYRKMLDNARRVARTLRSDGK